MRFSSLLFTLLPLFSRAQSDSDTDDAFASGQPGGELGWVVCQFATPEVWHFPYPGDCTKFIKCDIEHHLSTIYSCDKPLHFNPYIQTCDWSENAGCAFHV
ncbi:hypothetical protein ASPWEDRAFT_44799 [Aspergillus wentii DTO 134E9]|uniref:Chitin-binding type-2 domain-containing protein n=1 Tax=Aspergillus wentii DTO 134E9 TaxID=1073089 RepID=A0A1L9R7C7_ASPWE|nr:uncharacterized protein ASPWEDRAFT_44799 [Aspergillus wentii DTO 134E9]OJJ30819.1 hypothetical protein ASPWEDRAFT_44799 [Aspergillus wentii DTO 134E9]